jgi:centrosomal protein CEP290
MAAFKISALQKALDDCVPAHELDLANRQFTEVTEKYRDLLEKSNSLVVKTEQNSGFEVSLLFSYVDLLC